MLPAWQVHVIEQCFHEQKFAFFSEVKRHLPANYIARNDCVIYNFRIKYVDRLHISLHEYRTVLKICCALQFLVCNHVTRHPCQGSIEHNFFSKNLHENRIQFPEERNPFVLDRQHGRRDVTCKPAIHMGILFMGVWVGEGGVVLSPVSLVLELGRSKRSTIAVHSCPVRFKPS